MRRIIPTIHCCSSNEAENLGVFFMDWFKMIDRWCISEELWKKECDHPGFCKTIGDESTIIS